MGNKSAKKTNEMLGQQTGRFNQFADTMGQRGTEDRDYSVGSRGKIDQAYWDLYKGLDQGGGGGGGGPAYHMATYKDPRENEAQAMYRDWAKTGGISPEQEATFRARATSSLPGFFEGVKRQINPNVGYGSQLSKLGRDEGRALSEANLGAESDILGKRLENQKWGGTGLERTDESLIGRQMQVERERIAEQKAAQAAAMAAAGRGRANAQQAFSDRMAILGQLRGLRGEGGSDLAYADRQLAGLGGATGSVSARVAEPSAWDRALQFAQVGAAGAAPFVGGGAGKGSKKVYGMGDPNAVGG